MTTKPETVQPRRRLTPLLMAVYLPALLFLGIIGLASRYFGIPQGDFMRDPLQVLHQPPYLGLASYVGILIWCAAAAIGLFAAAALRDVPGAKATRRFLLWAGILTLWVALDDLFMLHDIVIPQLIHLREQFLFMVYGVIAAFYGVRFKEELLQRHSVLIWLTIVFATISVIMDNGHALSVIVGHPVLPENYLVEDGAKFLATVGWSAYVGIRSVEAVRSRIVAA